MTYRFSGAITTQPPLDLGSMGGLSRQISEPFRGAVHAFAADYADHELEDWETEKLLSWVRSTP